MHDTFELAEARQPGQWPLQGPSGHGPADDDVDQVGPGHGHGAKARQGQTHRDAKVHDGAHCGDAGRLLNGHFARNDGHGNGAKRYEYKAHGQHLHHGHHARFAEEVRPVGGAQVHGRCHAPRGDQQHAERVAQALRGQLFLASDERRDAKIAKHMGYRYQHRTH